MLRRNNNNGDNPANENNNEIPVDAPPSPVANPVENTNPPPAPLRPNRRRELPNPHAAPRRNLLHAFNAAEADGEANQPQDPQTPPTAFRVLAGDNQPLTPEELAHIAELAEEAQPHARRAERNSNR